MQAFNELRKAARDRRDKAIDKARTDYEATLVKIAAIEQDIVGREQSSHKSISACVQSVVPREGTFTTEDIMASLEALDPARPWRKRAIDHAISGMRRRGSVRRISKSKAGVRGKHNCAVYAWIDADVDAGPFADMPLPEVMFDVLRGKSMNRTELTVALVEAGYRTAMTQKGLRDHVGRILRADGRFRKSGDRWGC